MKQLRIRIFPDGTIESRTEGIKGEQCQSYRKVIEKITEAKYLYVEQTDEFYESIVEEQANNEALFGCEKGKINI